MRPLLPQEDVSVLGGGAVVRPPIGNSVEPKIIFRLIVAAQFI
jgi:hypothetical protein